MISLAVSCLASLIRRKRHLGRWKLVCKALLSTVIDTRSCLLLTGSTTFSNTKISDTLSLYRQKGDLGQLSSLGHFLKGSSATLGLTKVKDSCEKIQHFGARKDESGTVNEPDDRKSLNRIQETLATVKVEYAEAERLLKNFYGEAAA